MVGCVATQRGYENRCRLTAPTYCWSVDHRGFCALSRASLDRVRGVGPSFCVQFAPSASGKQAQECKRINCTMSLHLAVCTCLSAVTSAMSVNHHSVGNRTYRTDHPLGDGLFDLVQAM